MDINNYNNVVSNVNDLNNMVQNAKNQAYQAKEKIPGTIGDILTGDGFRELLGKVLSPLTQRALVKIGLAKDDAEDLSNGKLTKLALRKVKQKLGLQSEQEAKQARAQEQPEQPVENRGVPEEGNEPGRGVEEPELEDLAAEGDASFSAPTAESATLGDALQDSDLFESYARNTFPEFSDASSDFIEEARGQLNTLSDLDLEQPLSDLATRLAPGYRVLADVNNPASAEASNISELAETDENPLSLQTPRQLGRSVVQRPQQQAGQELHTDENTSGAGEELADEQGGDIRQLTSQATGSSSGSADASLSNVAENTAATAGEDAGLETATEDLSLTSGFEEAAASTAEIPGVGEILAPLLAIGGGLAAIFSHPHETKTPVLNPSYQFLG